MILQVILTGLLAGGIYGLITVGLTLIFGVLKLVNFAHGEFLMIGMYLTWLSVTYLNMNAYASIVLVIPVMFGFGLLIERFIMQPVLYSPHVIQILTTMGLSLALTNGAMIVFSPNFQSVSTSSKNTAIHLGNIYLSAPHVLSFSVAVVSVFLLWIFLQKTNTGMCMRSVAQNDKAAKLMGVNVNKIYLLAYGLGSALVGVAGVMLAPIYSLVPTIGSNFCMIAFVCLVLGGLGSIPGAMLGGLTVGIIESLTGFLIGSAYQQVGYFLIFIIILIVRPTGYLGKKVS